MLLNIQRNEVKDCILLDWEKEQTKKAQNVF